MAEQESVYKNTVEREELTSSVCAICFKAKQDARLLNCLHSFCKGCLDDLGRREGHARTITCPVCRATNYFPENGATGLPRDITVVGDTTTQCHTCTCQPRGELGKPEVSCTTCHLAFCNQHIVPHLLANSGHSVAALNKDSTVSSASSSQLCSEHGLLAKYYCKKCNVAVCGECVALGQHTGHQPIVSLSDIVKDVKKRVRRKTSLLRQSRLPEAQTSLSAVETVSIELSARADNIRTQIRASAKRDHDAIDLAMEQKLAQVDDLEELRLKHLKNQKDELKRHTNALKSVLCFEEKIMKITADSKEACDLLVAVEKRADELYNAPLSKKPMEHACVNFESVGKVTLPEKANEPVGFVLPCQASAKHSFIEGETGKASAEGSPVSYVAVAKDYNNRRMVTGGDTVRVKSVTSLANTVPSPYHDVVDNKNETYASTVRALQPQEYSFDVFVNNAKLQQQLSLTCHSKSVTFDLAECQAQSTISEDRLTVTHVRTNHRWSSVLSVQGMRTGEDTWKVKLTKSENAYVFLGVAEKPGLTAKQSNFMSTYSWNGHSGNRWIMNKKSPSMSQWQENDILQLHLNCNEHTLSIKNTRSGETATITNLPSKELFAYFATFQTSDSMTLIL